MGLYLQNWNTDLSFFRYFFFGIRHFSVFGIPTSVSVSVFWNTSVFGIGIGYQPTTSKKASSLKTLWPRAHNGTFLFDLDLWPFTLNCIGSYICYGQPLGLYQIWTFYIISFSSYKPRCLTHKPAYGKKITDLVTMILSLTFALICL